MPLSNLTELTASVADWLNRADLSSRVPDFIALAEADLNSKLRVQQMVKTKTAVLSSTRYPLPSDWLEAHSITVDQTRNSRLQYAPPDELYRIREEMSHIKYPTHYSLWGGNIEVAPVNADVTVQMSYYARLTGLSATNPTNWLLTLRPDAYLYGALVHAAPYLVEDERTAVWAAGYANAINSLNDADTKARFSGAPLVRRVQGFR